MTAFAFPPWAAVLFGNKPAAPERPDLPTKDAPAPLVEAKKKKGRPAGTKLTDEQKARIGQGVKRRNKERPTL